MKLELFLLGVTLGLIVNTDAHEDDPEVTQPHQDLRAAAKSAA